MKSRVLNVLLILTSLVGYLEWGKDNKSFLFQAESAIISKFLVDPGSVVHPFIVLPLAGQLLLFFTLFQKRPNRVLTFLGIAGLGILFALMLVIGLISLNYKIVLSTIPFLVIGLLTFRHHKKLKRMET